MRQAVVVGAGIGGLAAALALHRTGWDVTVLERAPELGAVGAGLTLWPNAMRALDVLQLGDAVRDRSVRIGASGGLRDPGGRLVVRTAGITEQVMTDLRALHRADLHAVLIDALPAGMVRTGCRVDSVGADIVLADGERVTADLIVGADGVDSAVRRAFWPDRPRYRGYTAWRGVTPPGAVRIDGGVGETWGRGTRFGIVGLNGDRTYWFAVANAEPGVRYDDEWAEVRRRFGSWHDPIPTLLDATPRQEVLHHDIVDLPPLKSYVDGRVVLLGDAAHAMTPDVGQGGCQALEDAVVLAAWVAAGDSAAGLDAGLARYDAERRPRTQSIARLARRIGRFAQTDNALLVPLRTQLLRLAPAHAAERTLDRITRWTPPPLD
jgi:2-polyprenyl-6-methoxyphenol hydroxylase-like FAD-dependent oxidoreductase